MRIAPGHCQSRLHKHLLRLGPPLVVERRFAGECRPRASPDTFNEVLFQGVHRLLNLGALSAAKLFERGPDVSDELRAMGGNITRPPNLLPTLASGNNAFAIHVQMWFAQWSLRIPRATTCIQSQ